MKIDNLTLQRIKDAASIVDVIGDFYEVKKKGVNWQCLCPFHTDHHLGSFVINPRRNTYTCFACGAHGDAIEFLMRHERLTFFQAVVWLGKKYGFNVEGGETFHPRPARPHQPAPKLPMLVIPQKIAFARLDTTQDTLCNWIRSLNWNSDQRARLEKVLRGYAVGHARQGYTIFWQIDERAQVRTGKFMLYNADGHRNKTAPRNFTWAHTLLRFAKLIPSEKEADMVGTLFGMHLLAFHPDADVCIVESEKTALLAAIMWGHPEQRIWMASGGLSFLSRERLQPLITQNRKVILFPDRDGIEAWKQQAMVIGYKNLEVNTKFVTEYWREADGAKADLGDIIVASLTERRTVAPPPCKAKPAAHEPQLVGDIMAAALSGIIRRNPAVGLLVDKLKLEIVNK